MKRKRRPVLFSAAKLARNEFMQKVSSQQMTLRPVHDMTVTAFRGTRFLPYCEEIVALAGELRRKANPVLGYQQIWNQHLKPHFGEMTLQEYDPGTGTELLQSLTNSPHGSSSTTSSAAPSSPVKRGLVSPRQVNTVPRFRVSTRFA